jgi:hypothetical protein
VAKKELNLFQFSAGGAAESSATSTKIVRRQFGNANSGGELLDDVPDELFRYSLSPSSTGATHVPEKPACVNSGRLCPFGQHAMHPIRDGNSSNVTSLSAQVHDRPMPFALLQVAESSSASSWRRSPQDSRTASSARSRLLFSRLPSGACQSACPCSAVNQLPSLTPSFLTPLDAPYPPQPNRRLGDRNPKPRMPAGGTAPSRRSIVLERDGEIPSASANGRQPSC